MTLKIKPLNKVHHFVVASDFHSEHTHLPSLNIMLKLAERIGKKKVSIIILGDFLDVPYFMKKDEEFQKWIKRPEAIDQFFLEKYNDEVDIGNSILDKCSSRFSKMIYMEGNHENRINLFRNSDYCQAGYKHIFNLRNSFKSKERDMAHLDYNDWIDLGVNLSLTHGMYCGPSALKKHFEAAGKSVMYGHVHSAEVKAFSSRGKTRKAWSLPTMGTLSPAYLKGVVNPWSNGFAVVSLKPNNHFQVHMMEVWDDQLILPTGEVIKG